MRSTQRQGKQIILFYLKKVEAQNYPLLELFIRERKIMEKEKYVEYFLMKSKWNQILKLVEEKSDPNIKSNNLFLKKKLKHFKKFQKFS